jgi:hypothetical protein
LVIVTVSSSAHLSVLFLLWGTHDAEMFENVKLPLGFEHANAGTVETTWTAGTTHAACAAPFTRLRRLIVRGASCVLVIIVPHGRRFPDGEGAVGS